MSINIQGRNYTNRRMNVYREFHVTDKNKDYIHMKSMPFAILLLFIATGCTKHQYFSVSSQLPKQLDGSFKFEDDTVKVLYGFTQEGNIRIEITNKLDHLIYVDLEKSSMIFNSESFAYSDGKAAFDGSSSTYESGDFQAGGFSGTLAFSPHRKYIPPGSKVSHEFKKVPFEYQRLNKMKRERSILSSGASAKRYSLSEDDSVSTYQSYLYVSDDSNNAKPHVMKHHFWISYIVETLDGSQHLSLNQFERSKLTAAGGFLATAGIVGLVSTAVKMEENSTER